MLLISYIVRFKADLSSISENIQNCSGGLFTTWKVKARDHTNDAAVKAGGLTIQTLRDIKVEKMFDLKGVLFLTCYIWCSYVTPEKKTLNILKTASVVLVLYFITLSICKYIVIVKTTLLNLSCDTITLAFTYAAVDSGVNELSWSGFYKVP